MTQIEQHAIPPQSTGVDLQELVAAYLAAWNAHDGAAVAALVTGSYVDPTLPEPISGDAIAAMVDGLCAAFPDLRFEQVSCTAQDERAAFEWRMRGTNDGAALPGAPAPTGGTIDLPGMDVLTTAAGRIADVVGYFDQQAFLSQVGLQTFVMPKDEWPVGYGTSVRLDLGNATEPGAMTFTWIDVAPEQQGELIARTTDILRALAGEPSFLGFQSTTVGSRATTVTMWTSPEAAEAALARSAPHNAAMERVERGGFGTRGYTSFWQPYRVNAQFVVCACGASVALAGGVGTCGCGEQVQAQPYI